MVQGFALPAELFKIQTHLFVLTVEDNFQSTNYFLLIFYFVAASTQQHTFKRIASSLIFEVPIMQDKKQSNLPKAPPVPEEPLDQMAPSLLVCRMCGKTFKTHIELDRHTEQMHGQPEKTHTKPHTNPHFT